MLFIHGPTNVFSSPIIFRSATSSEDNGAGENISGAMNKQHAVSYIINTYIFYVSCIISTISTALRRVQKIMASVHM